MEHKTALQLAVERVTSAVGVELVGHLLDMSLTYSARRWTQRADNVEHLLDIASSLPTTQDEQLRRHLVQLLNDHRCRRRSASTATIAAAL